jgi:hypothetical protein
MIKSHFDVQDNLEEEQKLVSEMHYVTFHTILSPCQVAVLCFLSSIRQLDRWCPLLKESVPCDKNIM